MQKYDTAPTISAFYSGATAGALVSIITHPFDTVKSIRQVQLGKQQMQISQSTIEILKKMLREQGIRSWYKGNYIKKIII